MNGQSNGFYLLFSTIVFLAGVAWSAEVLSTSFVNVVEAFCSVLLVFFAYKALNSWFTQKTKEQELSLLGDVVSYYHAFCDLFPFYQKHQRELGKINKSLDEHEHTQKLISQIDAQLAIGATILTADRRHELYSTKDSLEKKLLNQAQQNTLRERTARLQSEYERLKEQITKCEQNMFKSSAQLLQRREINSLVEQIIYPREEYVTKGDFDTFYLRVNDIYKLLQSHFFDSDPIDLIRPTDRANE